MLYSRCSTMDVPRGVSPAAIAEPLAIDGGTPIRTTTLPLSRPWIGQPEIDAAADAIRSGSLAGGGPYGRRAEERLAAALDGARPLLMTSCTSALEAAVMLSGIGPGDEVICPSFTFVSAATAVVRAGGRPVFADIDPRTLNVDPDSIERAIGPKTRAIVIVHYGGRACDMERILRLAERHGLRVIEDAAHALGARWRGAPLGALGDFGCFSFHGTKDVVCGEGGALICRSEADRVRAEILREKGTNRAQFVRGDVAKYTWVDEGSSFIASEVVAAILAAQLERLPAILARKRQIAARLTAWLDPLADRVTLPREWAGIESSWHIYPILVPPAERDRVLKALHAEGIGAAFHYVPLHSAPFSRARYGYAAADLPHTEEISASLIRLPFFAAMSDADADDVAAATLKVIPRLLSSTRA